MAGLASLFEPEELFGAYWHRLVGETGVEQRFAGAGVSLSQVQRRLEIFFRGLGGKPGVVIKAIAPQSADYRKSFMARIGHAPSAVSRARFDGDHLFLPGRIELLDQRALNEDIYRWLVAFAAMAGEDSAPVLADALQNDIAAMRFARLASQKVCTSLPGMKPVHDRLAAALLKVRRMRRLPAIEAAIEACICASLGAPEPDRGPALDIWQALGAPDSDLSCFHAPRGYKTFLPCALWGEVLPVTAQKPYGKAWQEASAAPDQKDDGRSRRAKRQKADQIDNKNALVLHRFESILSWAEMMNIPRPVDDDDVDNARKAADDAQELGLAQSARKAASKLKFDLDLAPQDVEHERLAARYVYDEWDYRKNGYHRDHCRVLAGPAPTLKAGESWQPDKAARRRIRAVKRQFEALRPGLARFHRQADGNEIDMDALIRSRCDISANGDGSERVFTSTRQCARDLSVAVLIDISRSSESWIEGRQVIEISREVLLALTAGLAASGDDNAIFSFSSLRRDRVIVSSVKDFDEQPGPEVFSRIAALRPGFYTRLGAAMRHVQAKLAGTASSKRLLLVLTDGKPNDLDHYEGRYGIEDTAMAVREARRAGTAVFGLTIDKKAQSYFPYIFGRNAYAIASHPAGLTRALPLMYRQLVT